MFNFGGKICLMCLKVVSVEDVELPRLYKTLKVFNNFENSAFELKMLKNFTFKIKKQQIYADYDSQNNFFSEVSGQFYQINRLSNKIIKFHPTFGFSNQVKDSKRLLSFSSQSSGVRVGEYFWILGGYEECKIGATNGCSFSTTQAITQRKTKLYNIKKSVWIDGPKLPKSIWLYHASASAINSSHVVFVGANSYFEEGCKKLNFIRCLGYRTNIYLCQNSY